MKLTYKMMSQVLSYRFSYLGKYYKDTNNETDDKLIDNKTETNQYPTKLLCFDAMPRHLQFNPFVHTGYRPQMNAWECIVSLTYLHNETINILSHGLPLLYALWSLPSLLPWNEMPLPVLPYFHAAATICPWLGSSIYHLFMNHHSGCSTYASLLQWDVAGVWVTQSCGGFTSVFVGIRCLPWPIRYLLLLIYIAFALKALHAAVFAVGPWERRISFAAMFIMRILILSVRYSRYGGGHPEALYHCFLQDFWSLVGAVVSASLIPERWLPGKPADLFDVENPDWIPSLNMGYHKKRILNTMDDISELNCESSTSDSSASTSEEMESVCKRSVGCQTDYSFQDLRAMENAYADTIKELIEVRDKVSKLSIHEDAFKDNDLKTRNYTGIPSYGMLMTIYEMLEKDLTHYSASALTKFQRYMLTLMRLRLNLDLNDLARRFCVSKSTVLKAFQTTINVMYQKFENVLVWPDRDVITIKEPQSFVETYGQRVAVIVNTFEIITNKPQHAKYANTKKFLIGICPQGGITFISSSWEGDTPDEHIVANCGILGKLLPGDIIICDSGVSIHSDDPEDVDGDVEMTEQNKSHFQRYAERVISRLKMYKFLQRTMPSTTISSSNPEVPPLLDQVVKVCCCLINISSLVVPFDETIE